VCVCVCVFHDCLFVWRERRRGGGWDVKDGLGGPPHFHTGFLMSIAFLSRNIAVEGLLAD